MDNETIGLTRKLMDQIPTDMTDPPVFTEPESTMFITQSIRHPKTGRLCYSISEYEHEEKKVSTENEIN